MTEPMMSERAPATAEAKPNSPNASSNPEAAASAPDLPPIAADANDLRAIKSAVDDAASVGGTLRLSYLFVLFYFAVAAGAVTHADLFFENPVKLPFLNLELSLFAFFFLAPILFLIVHAYTLVHLVMLTGKAKRFHQKLREQIGGKQDLPEDELKRRDAIRTGVLWQLPSNIFIQFLAGPEPTSVRERAFRWLLWVIAIVTLAVAPVLLLLLLQLQFLPYHSSFVTSIHRVVLLLDLGLTWWLWSMILSGHEADGRRWASWVWARLGILLGVCAFLFSSAVATFPGEWQERLLARLDKPRLLASLHGWAFDPNRRGWLHFSSTLVLPGLNIYDNPKIGDPEKAKWRDYIFLARGRDLKGAILNNSNLPRVDFTSAELQGATLSMAQLQLASLDGAQLQGADLGGAKLQGATLFAARLQGALLFSAQLQGALLNAAQLQGAVLNSANFQGASLDNAQLQGASLVNAELQGVNLFAANLQGASLSNADLQGALLSNAQLQGATLQQALLQATDLSDSLLWRTNSDPPSTHAPAAIRLPDATKPWGPLFWLTNSVERRPWSKESYEDLRNALDSLLSDGQRISAFKLLQRLDCANPDPTLTSCDAPEHPSPEAVKWQKSLEEARVDDPAYFKALASVLRKLVCEGLGGRGGAYTGGRAQRLLDYAFMENTLFALCGLMASDPFNAHLALAGTETPALVDFIMGKDCLVSASLTDADKARLLQIKQDAIENAGQ